MTVCTFLTIFFLSMLTRKLKKYYSHIVTKSKQVRNTILSEEEILGGSMPAEKQGL